MVGWAVARNHRKCVKTPRTPFPQRYLWILEWIHWAIALALWYLHGSCCAMLHVVEALVFFVGSRLLKGLPIYQDGDWTSVFFHACSCILRMKAPLRVTWWSWAVADLSQKSLRPSQKETCPNLVYLLMGASLYSRKDLHYCLAAGWMCETRDGAFTRPYSCYIHSLSFG